MSRYEQRRRSFLRDPTIAEGYWEQDSEYQLLRAIDALRKHMDLSMEELARRMERKREALSRLFNSAHPNPQLDTITALLKAMNVTAEVRLRPSREGDPPLRIIEDTPSGVA